MTDKIQRTRATVLKVDLPVELQSLLGSSAVDAATYLKRLALIELFRRGEVSSGYAAEVLGISRWEFIQLLGQHGVPYLDQSPEELQHDVEVLESYLASRPNRS